MLKKSGKNIVKILLHLIDKLIGLFRNDHREILLSTACSVLESNNDIIVYRFIPKMFNNSPLIINLNKRSQFAIVIQGPICVNDDITYNTIMFYKRVYTNAKIILSTWDDEPEGELKKISVEGVEIVKTKRPEENGLLNVNYQLVNSLEGIKRAKALGYTYVVKTRTDQRVCKTYAFDFILNAIQSFPSDGSQMNRIALLSTISGNMFTPYFMSDFLYFGYVDDMLALFSAPLDTRKIYNIPSNLTRRQAAEHLYAPEIYILTHYLADKIGYNCESTVKAYWDTLKKYFICLSMKDVGLLWTKYDFCHELNFYYSEYFGTMDSEESMSTLNFDFMNWFNLYSGITTYQEEFEKYADIPLDLKNK